MPSKSKSIDKTDIKRWGVVVLIGAGVGAINALAGQVIPEIRDIEGPTTTFIVLGLTLVIDFLRRYFKDTSVVDPENVEKLTVNTKEDVTIKEDNVGLIDWILRKRS
jgi:hypothetical protein